MSEANKQLSRRWFEEVWRTVCLKAREAAIDELLAPRAVSFGLAEPGTEVHAAAQVFRA